MLFEFIWIICDRRIFHGSGHTFTVAHQRRRYLQMSLERWKRIEERAVSSSGNTACFTLLHFITFDQVWFPLSTTLDEQDTSSYLVAGVKHKDTITNSATNELVAELAFPLASIAKDMSKRTQRTQSQKKWSCWKGDETQGDVQPRQTSKQEKDDRGKLWMVGNNIHVKTSRRAGKKTWISMCDDHSWDPECHESREIQRFPRNIKELRSTSTEFGTLSPTHLSFRRLAGLVTSLQCKQREHEKNMKRIWTTRPIPSPGDVLQISKAGCWDRTEIQRSRDKNYKFPPDDCQYPTISMSAERSAESSKSKLKAGRLGHVPGLYSDSDSLLGQKLIASYFVGALSSYHLIICLNILPTFFRL